MLAFWDTFGEIFGMPMRIARTTSRDQKEIDRLDKMLREAGNRPLHGGRNGNRNRICGKRQGGRIQCL